MKYLLDAQTLLWSQDDTSRLSAVATATLSDPTHDRIWRVAETHVSELTVMLEPMVPAPPAEGQGSAE